MTGTEPDPMADPNVRAYVLGALERHLGRPLRCMSDADSPWLMAEIGETGPATAANRDARLDMCWSYEDGWHDADDAISEPVDQDGRQS